MGGYHRGMGGPTGSRTNRGRMGDSPLLFPFLLYVSLNGCLVKGGKLNYKEQQSEFQETAVLL